MRRRIVQAVNFLLALFGARLIRTIPEPMDVTLAMPTAIQRIAEHGIPIRSIIDIGASNGTWSEKTMITFPRASFLAIEPLHERQEALERVKKKTDNFDYVLCIAGDKDRGEATLVVSEDLDGSTVDGVGGKPRTVATRTIDSIVAEKALPGPFLLKFDTHGYEIPILAGAKDTLVKTNVIFMEVYNFNITQHSLRFPDMCSHLERLGFRCYDIVEPRLRRYDKAFWQMDILFTRSDSRIFSYSQYK
jgi:FkbM family methyltransferase